jgi:hypothetical protein
MVPMHGKNGVEALHEPGSRRCEAVADLAMAEVSHRVTVAATGCDPNVRSRFMVPIHAEKTKGGSP